jgi:lysophospholipase L1-like esterase
MTTDSKESAKLLYREGCAWPPLHGTTLRAFGDSFTVGYQASDDDHKWTNIVAAKTGWTLTNSGNGGSQLADVEETHAIYQTRVQPDDNFALLTGFNDYRLIGTDAIRQQHYEDNLAAVAAWLTIPESRKIRAQSSAVAYTGSWVDAPAYGGGLTRASNIKGSTATAQVWGKTIYIGMTRITDGTQYATYSITVDGVAAAAGDCAATRNTYRGQAYYPFLIRLPQNREGIHTVAVTVSRSVNDGYAYLDWIAGLPERAVSPEPTLLLGNACRMTPSGYANPQNAPFTVGSDEVAAQFNRRIREVALNLASDRLDCVWADVSRAFDPSIHVGPDNLHPNDLGYQAIASAFLDPLTSRPSGRDPLFRRRPVARPVGTSWLSP